MDLYRVSHCDALNRNRHFEHLAFELIEVGTTGPFPDTHLEAQSPVIFEYCLDLGYDAPVGSGHIEDQGDIGAHGR